MFEESILPKIHNCLVDFVQVGKISLGQNSVTYKCKIVVKYFEGKNLIVLLIQNSAIIMQNSQGAHNRMLG